MENVMWLAIKSGTRSAVPPLVGYGQIVPTCGGCQSTLVVEDMYYDMIPGILGIVRNARCLAQWC